jgi:hypothetical protein
MIPRRAASGKHLFGKNMMYISMINGEMSANAGNANK